VTGAGLKFPYLSRTLAVFSLPDNSSVDCSVANNPLKAGIRLQPDRMRLGPLGLRRNSL
jgi:hypothetical protein